MADTRLTLSIPEDEDALEQTLEKVDELAETHGWPQASAYQIRLAIEEIVLNVIKYGVVGGGQIDIDISPGPDAVSVRISDNGKAFDPTHDSEAPDTDAQLQDRPIGGLGVFLVGRVMDEFHYVREQGLNVVTLIKRL